MDLNGRRVAIVMMSAVGDAVHVLPLVNSLKAAYPSVHLTWIIQPGPHALVKDHPAVDEFVVFDRKRGWRAFADVRRAVRGKRFDLVIALQVYFKAGLITAMLDSPRKLGFDRARARDANWLFTTERIPARGQRHVQDQYFEFLEHLGVPIVLEWGLGPTEEERRRYADLLPPTPAPRWRWWWGRASRRRSGRRRATPSSPTASTPSSARAACWSAGTRSGRRRRRRR